MAPKAIRDMKKGELTKKLKGQSIAKQISVRHGSKIIKCYVFDKNWVGYKLDCGSDTDKSQMTVGPTA